MSRIVKEMLVKYSRLAHERGLTAAFGGNLSVLFNGKVFIKATGSVMGELTQEQIAVIDLDGNVLSLVKPSSEWKLHVESYKRRGDIRAIAHLHPPYSIVASTLLSEELPIITPEAEIYLKKIPIAEFKPAGSWELAKETAKYLEHHDAVILQNHGIVTVGKSLREAYYKAELVEESAKLWYLKEKGKQII